MIFNPRMNAMTQEEADKIARVVRTADKGCGVCVRNLVERLNDAALGFVFSIPDDDPTVEETVQSGWSNDPEDVDINEWPNVIATNDATEQTDWRKRTNELWEESQKLKLLVRVAAGHVPADRIRWHENAADALMRP